MNMAAYDIQIHFRCEDCTFDDKYGRSCKHGLLFPVLLFISGAETCPNFKNKTTEQIREQLQYD